MHPALLGLMTIIMGVGGCVGYFWLSNFVLDRFIFPPSGPNAGRNINRANIIRPWLFLFPALFALSIYLAYPVVETIRLSLTERVTQPDGTTTYDFVGLANYAQMMDEPKFWEALSNNMLWLIIVPAMSTAFGLLAAQLTDRIGWGSIAKSLIFMPMAISFVGAAVIWKLVYDTRPEGQDQIGALNALWLMFSDNWVAVLCLRVLPILILLAIILAAASLIWSLIKRLGATVTAQWQKLVFSVVILLAAAVIWISVSGVLGIAAAELAFGKPQTWLTIPFWNSIFLMAVLVWIQTGFAMVILSAALRGIPEETIEAAIVDGANPFQVFFKIKVPQIMGTIVVVWTTITIVVLKVFDIVFAMTNGQWETQVLANYMYDKMFRANDWGVGSASAMVIMLLVTPILVWNVYNARKEMR